MQKPQILIKDKNMRNLGVLDRAFRISVKRRVNELWTASFLLPKNDAKNALCSHLNYVEITSASGRNLGLYRIMPTETRRSESNNFVKYECEHVLSTLLDDVMVDYTQFTNMTTEYVLGAILDMQTTKRWQLGQVDFTRRFHYKFENENGLLAPILSIPKPFKEPYMFTFDTTVYPWTLNLERTSEAITSEIRWGKDMRDFSEFSDPTKIVNYIVPKGAGEGVNQLTIESVNGGLNYVKDDESIAKWGRQNYIWIDRRYEDALSLKEAAEALLDEWKEPSISMEVDAADLSILPEYEHERRILGGVTRIIVEDDVHLARITGEVIEDLEREWDVKYEINNGIDDVSTTTAEIERRQQVNDAYSQGATNILAFSYQDNADGDTPAVIPFYIDDDVVNVNTLELTYRTKPFRAYSQATKGGGATVKSTSSGGGTSRSTSSGGGTTATSSSGGGTSRSTDTGGGTSRTSAAGGDHRHVMFRVVGYEQNMQPNTNAIAGAYGGSLRLPGDTGLGEYITDSSSGNHTHNFTYPAHSHEFTVPNHTHNVVIPNHSHEFTTPNHTHDIELPDHTHEVEHKIVELNSIPSSVTIKVDGNTIPRTAINGDRINLVDYIAKDSNGKIQRGRHEVTIKPNGLARIEADLILRVFVQSHLGGKY